MLLEQPRSHFLPSFRPPATRKDTQYSVPKMCSLKQYEIQLLSKIEVAINRNMGRRLFLPPIFLLLSKNLKHVPFKSSNLKKRKTNQNVFLYMSSGKKRMKLLPFTLRFCLKGFCSINSDKNDSNYNHLNMR